MDDQTTQLRKDDQGHENPYVLFNEWLKLAEASEPNDPTAMSVASVDETGMPNVRMVLMRRHDERGIVFFTNFESQKGGRTPGFKKSGSTLSLEIVAEAGPHSR